MPRFRLEAGRFLFIRDVFHHVLNAAIQDFAEHLDRVGTDVFVVLHAGDLAGADVELVDERVLRHAPFAHGFP